MLDNFPTDEDKTGGKRNMVLQKDGEDSMDGVSNRKDFKKMSTFMLSIRKGQLILFRFVMKNKGLQNLSLSGHIKGKSYRRRQLVTYMMSLCEWVAELALAKGKSS